MIQGILSKIFKAREKVARDLTGQEIRKRKAVEPDWDPDEDYNDDEKPFLEHLEDLRSMLVQMVATLLIATLVCFGFHRQLTDILKYPLERAGLDYQIEQVQEIDAERSNNKKTLEKPETTGGAKAPKEDAEESKEGAEGAEIPGKGAESAGVGEAESAEDAERADGAAGIGDEEGEGTLGSGPTPPRPGSYQVGDAPPESGSALGDLYYDINTRQLKVFNGAAWDLVGDRASGQFALTTVDVTGVFMMSIKVSLFSAIVVAFPLLLYFLLQFVLPGMKRKEKRVLWPSMAIGFGLFILGVVFAYFIVLPRALEFFHLWAQKQGVDTIWTIERYVTFCTRFLLVFGISFELPVLVMALVKIDILNYSIMKGTRRHAIVGILVFAAIVTPTTDPGTLMLLSLPMCILYEICIWIAYFMEKRDRELYPELYEAWDNAHMDEDSDPWESDHEEEGGEHGGKTKGSAGAIAVSPANPVPYGKEDEVEGEMTLEEFANQDEDYYGYTHHNFPRFTESQLMRKKKDELIEIAETLGCPCEGTKQEITRMILDHL